MPDSPAHFYRIKTEQLSVAQGVGRGACLGQKSVLRTAYGRKSNKLQPSVLQFYPKSKEEHFAPRHNLKLIWPIKGIGALTLELL